MFKNSIRLITVCFNTLSCTYLNQVAYLLEYFVTPYFGKTVLRQPTNPNLKITAKIQKNINYYEQCVLILLLYYAINLVKTGSHLGNNSSRIKIGE